MVHWGQRPGPLTTFTRTVLCAGTGDSLTAAGVTENRGGEIHPVSADNSLKEFGSEARGDCWREMLSSFFVVVCLFVLTIEWKQHVSH